MYWTTDQRQKGTALGECLPENIIPGSRTPLEPVREVWTFQLVRIVPQASRPAELLSRTAAFNRLGLA